MCVLLCQTIKKKSHIMPKDKSRTDFTKLSKEELTKECWKLDKKSRSGWRQYYRTLEEYDDDIHKHHAEMKKLKDMVTTMSSSNDGTIELCEYLETKILEGKKLFECPICKDDCETKEKGTYSMTVCGHFFCKSCYDGWIREQKRDTCPVCRHNLGIVH